MFGSSKSYIQESSENIQTVRFVTYCPILQQITTTETKIAATKCGVAPGEAKRSMLICKPFQPTSCEKGERDRYLSVGWRMLQLQCGQEWYSSVSEVSKRTVIRNNVGWRRNMNWKKCWPMPPRRSMRVMTSFPRA